jgi:hypothetical protein
MAITLSADRASAMTLARVRRIPSDLYGVATLLVLTAVVGWDRLGDSQALSRTDILTFYLPWYAHLGEQLRDFDIPGWNPHVFSGLPFAGDPQSGWMYLPAMLFFTLLPPIAAFTVFVLFHLALGGLSTYALARVLGMRILPSMVAGIGFEFGTLLEHTRCCTIRAQLAVWIPLALLGVELATRARSPLARLGWLTAAGFAVSQMLAGWIGQGAYIGLLAVGGYVLYRTVISPAHGGDARSRLVALVTNGSAVLAIGFGLAAAGLLPRLDVVGRSNLAGGDYSGTAGEGEGGWRPLHLLYRLISDDGISLRWYVGGALLTLALLAPLAARRKYAVPYFFAFSVVIVFLGGQNTLLHELFYVLPRFEDLHAHSPNRALAILSVGIALLAAATVETIPRWTRHWWALPLLVLPLLALRWANERIERMTNDWVVTNRTAAAVGAVCAILGTTALLAQEPVRRRLPRASSVAQRAVPALLIAIIFLDPAGFSLGNSVRDSTPDPHPQQTVETLSSASDAGGAGAYLQGLGDAGQWRYFGYDAGLLGGDRRNQTYQGRYRQQAVIPLLVNNRSMRLGIDDVQGYNPIQVERYTEFVTRLNGERQNYHDSNILPGGLDSPMLDLLNVRYIVIPADIPPGRPDLLHLSQRHPTVFSGNGVRVLERDSALPRAWIVHDAREIDEGEALELLARGAVDPRQTVLLETAPPSVAVAPDGAEESATVTKSAPDELTLDVTATADGLVVLSEIYSPGWHAYLDGEEVPIHIANHTFRAVPVSAGEHTLELRYDPPWLRVGLVITLATIAALAAAAIVPYRRQKSQMPNTTIR